MNNKPDRITILGVGNILLTDEGFGVHLVNRLEKLYNFPAEVQVLDGGTLGLNLLHIILETDKLIVVDIIRNGEPPGTLYKIDHEDIPKRIKSKTSVHQLDFIETLTKGAAIGKMPETVILGVEPKDIETYCLDLTPVIEKAINPVIDMVLSELDKLKITYSLKKEA